MVLADVVKVNFIPDNGFLDVVFHKTWFAVSLFNVPEGGYKVTLIQLIILLIIAFAVNAITERLTGTKVGGLAVAVIVTIIGSLAAAAFINLPFDLVLEGEPIIAALIGAIIIGVFATLIRKSFQGK